jgi:hypothetical protein
MPQHEKEGAVFEQRGKTVHRHMATEVRAFGIYSLLDSILKAEKNSSIEISGVMLGSCCHFDVCQNLRRIEMIFEQKSDTVHRHVSMQIIF